MRVDLTPEQAAAFQRGESITLVPPAPEKDTYMIVGSRGTVYRLRVPAGYHISGTFRTLSIPSNVGARMERLHSERGLPLGPCAPCLWAEHRPNRWFRAIKLAGDR